MTLFFTILHIFLCLILVLIVLLQHGKGADVGVVLGGGASQTVFGSRGAGNFLTKMTTGAAVLFMVTSLFLSYYATPPSATELIQSGAPAELPASPQVPIPPPVPAEAPEPDASTDVPGGFGEIPPPPPAPATEGAGLD